MRFTQYLINEKITKKELKDVFNNNNIYIGAEFEFIHDRIKDNIEGGSGSDRQQAYEAAKREWEQWSREMEEWQDEYNEINRQIFHKENDIEDLESEIQDLESNKLDLEEKIRKSYDADEDEETRQKIEDIQKQIDSKTNELEDLESEKKDYESDLEMHETDGVPQPGMDYVEYMEEYSAGLRGLDPTDLPEPNEPDDSEIGEEDWLEIARDVLPNSIESGAFKFLDNYEIGGYGDISQFKGDDEWAFEYDGTVSPYGGVEMKSPPLPLPDFMDKLPDILDWIDDVGGTDSHCGLHFHMSLNNVNDLQSSLDMVKLVLFSEEEYIYKFFPERIDSDYAREVKDKIISGGPSQVKKYVKELFGGKKKITVDDAADLLGSHYDAIHKVRDSNNQTHVEFRHLGGNNYHNKVKEIRSLIGKYAATLSLACDPEYKYREYVNKLVRIINKIEKVSLMGKYDTLKFLVDDLKGDKKAQFNKLKQVFNDKPFVSVTQDNFDVLIKLIEQRVKELKQQINNLGVKVSSKEKHTITRRLNLSNMMEEEKDKIREKLRKRS